MSHKSSDDKAGDARPGKPAPVESEESVVGEEDPGSALDVQVTDSPPHHDGAHPEETEQVPRR